MSLKKDYPYYEAIENFSSFLNKVVQDEEILKEFDNILIDASKRKTFPMRGLHEKLMSYRKKNNSFKKFSEEDKEMIHDLMHFWG